MRTVAINRTLLSISLLATLFLSSCQKEELAEEEKLKTPTAEFYYSLSKGETAVIVNFINKSEMASQYKWLFQDRIVSEEVNPQLKVTTGGEVTVELKAINELGTSTKKITFDIPESYVAYLDSDGDITEDYPSNQAIPADAILTNVSYSWWCDPISYYKDGINFFSVVDINGAQNIYRYNSQTKELKSKQINSGYVRDEHNTLSFILLDNKILTVCTGHDEDNYVRYRTLSSDFEQLSATKLITYPKKTSYTQIFKAGNRIFVTTRCIEQWYVCWSDDEGENWTTPKVLFVKTNTTIPGAFYIRPIVISSTKIKFGTYIHPVTAGDKLKLFYVEMNPSTGDFSTEKDGVRGNLYSPTYAPLDMETLDVIYSASPGETFRFLDIAETDNGNTAFLIANTSVSNYNVGNYRYLERNHTTHQTSMVEMVAHGSDLPHATYYGGAYFVVNQGRIWNKTVYLAREQNADWYVEGYKFQGNGFTLENLYEKYDKHDNRTLSRPIPPINSEYGGFPMMYQRGEYYDYPSYQYWRNMDLVVPEGKAPTSTKANIELVSIQ